MRGNLERALASDFHAHKTLVPAFDNLASAQSELELHASTVGVTTRRYANERGKTKITAR
jgi:hypothetical protein